MPLFFILLSGEHPTLPLAEARAILDASGGPYEIVSHHRSLLRVHAEAAAADLLSRRGLMLDFVADELFASPSTDQDSILVSVRSLDLSRYISHDETFSVRIKVTKGPRPSRPVIPAGEIGELIGRQTNTRVNLSKPDVEFIGVMSPEEFVFGKVAWRKPRRSVVGRLPRRRPAFHPSTMQPKLARAMVNLSRPSESGIFLDPFCGVGGLLLEAGLIGCQVIGIDLRRRMVRGARRNLRHYAIVPLGMFVGDARSIPILQGDAVAGDPPYGREASTGGLDTKEIVTGTLGSIADRLPNVHHVCLALPHTIDADEVAGVGGFRVTENHSIRVHRNLTRQIVTFTK